MVKDDDDESLSEYQLRTLWHERETRRDLMNQDKGVNIKSLVATPERLTLTIMVVAQMMGFGPDVLTALAKILGVK
jgi:hypothetical protein